MSGAPTRARRRCGLQLQLILAVAGCAALFSVLAGAAAYHLGHQRAMAGSRAALEGLAAAVEKTAAVGVFARDAVLLREIAGGLARNTLVARVDVLDAGAQVLAEVAAAGATAAPARASTLERTLASPFDPAERMGLLRIHVDDARIDAAARSQAVPLAAAMAGQAALVALVLYLVAARLVSRPIIDLAAQLHRMMPGTSERLATPRNHRRDEIGSLIAAANALLDTNERALNAERSLRAEIEAMEAQYRQIFDSSSAGIFVLDVNGRLINGNPTISKVVGIALTELRELHVDAFLARVFDRPEQVRQMIEESARRGETVSADLELVQRSESRRWVHCLISVQAGDEHGRSERESDTVEGVIYDITDRKRVENAVRYRAEHDALTGLMNRAASHATLARLVDEAKATGSALSIAYMDLDGFKQINDTHGHASGDEVLQACAERMRRAIRRSSDLVGRLGGDEFIFTLRGVGPGDSALSATLQEILDSIARPIRLSIGATVQVGASIGVACLPRHGTSPQALTLAADAALYQVKRSGKRAFALALQR